MTDNHETEKSYPASTGAGALTGATAAGLAGTAMGGPVGGVIGAVLGAFAGGAAGHEIAEELDPTDEDSYWRKNYAIRPYAGNKPYSVYRPAYAYGWTTRRAYLDREFDEMEAELKSGWDNLGDKVELKWDQARDAVRDGWERFTRSVDRLIDDEDDELYSQFGSRSYATGASYDTYRPAYRFGARNRISRWGERFDEIEDDLEHEWDQFGVKARLKWAQARDAVRDGWHNIERRLPGDFDDDGR